MTVSVKYAGPVASLVVVASYACSFLFVDWLTNDIRRFMLPVLECAFLLLALSLRFLLPVLPRSVKLNSVPHRLRDNFRRNVA